MGEYYPAMATGGASWFTDLTAADPTYAFPVITAFSFWLMIELGADGTVPWRRTPAREAASSAGKHGSSS